MGFNCLYDYRVSLENQMLYGIGLLLVRMVVPFSVGTK